MNGVEFSITKLRHAVKVWADVPLPSPPISTPATKKGLKAAIDELLPSSLKIPPPRRGRTVPARAFRGYDSGSSPITRYLSFR